MENIVLEFRKVTGKGRKFKLEDISFALPAGYIMGLMGVNGAGKTTLMSYIMNEKGKYTGEILINGENIRDNHAWVKNKIGFVSEKNLFFENRTARQNMELLRRLYEEFDEDIFYDAMKEMEAPTGISYQKMSRGEKLKFQMAFAMAHKPTLYLLDEVTAGMDPVFRTDFHKMLHKVIAEEKASVLMSSHIESELEQKTDYVGILEEGRLREFGESPDVIPVYQEEVR